MSARVLIAGGLALAALGFAGVGHPAWRIAYNPSLSAQRGWYGLGAPDDLPVGMQVLAWPPPDAAALADVRHYVPHTVPLLKTVAAVRGARVCRHGAALTIDGRLAAVARTADRSGRVLPVWRGCRTLAPGELLLLAPDRPDSFDGRYFGPVHRRAVIARAIPLWTW